MRSIDQELGFRQIASMLKSGLPLLSALETCEEHSSRGAAGVWRKLADDVSAGSTLSAALGEVRGFDSYLLALIRVGEETGELDKVMLAAANYLAKRREHRAIVVNALFYPVIVVLMTFGVVWFMMVKVIPALKQFLEGQKAKLPEITVMLMDCSDAVSAYGPKWLLGLGVAIVALWIVRRNDEMRELTDAAVFKIPVVGNIMRLSATAVFARSMSLLLESGVTMLAGLDSVATLFVNRRLTRRVRDARDGVIKGGTLSESMVPAVEFLPILRKMVAVGESAGTLGITLEEVARFHEERLAVVIKRFGMIMEPVMIIIVGSIVGFVYIAFFMAIFSLAGGH